MSLLPALTVNNQRPSSLKASAPCEPRLLPVPVPPVATVPAAVSVPAAERWKIATAFPPLAATWFISVYTAPGVSSASAALAALALSSRRRGEAGAASPRTRGEAAAPAHAPPTRANVFATDRNPRQSG